MAEINPPAWQQAGSYPARTDRLSVITPGLYPGMAADESFPLRSRGGVRPSYQNAQMKVRAAPTPNMTVIVSAGWCWVDNRDSSGYGAYTCVNDADEILTVQPAGGVGQYRKDTVVAAVYDAETAGAVNEWRLEVIQGPYAASAGATVRGTLPPNCEVLADIAIAPSQATVAAGNITDVRRFAQPWGPVPLMSSADLDRPAVGQLRYRMDTDEWRYGKQDGTSGTLQRALPGAWTPWTPTWTTDDGIAIPSYGNATVNAYAVKIGRTTFANFEIIFGTTTNFGSGASAAHNWLFGLPYASARADQSIGFAELNNGTVGGRGLARCRINPALTAIYLDLSTGRVDGATWSGGVIDGVSPWTWASGYSIRGSVQYEAAS
ncbi:hypothetical protein AQ490_23185 [Wenjunlia vitaminophila]|uniref:Uncharacterized protein n=1 Tax=Wenjunlia vitaminophila TaxID=76728 RepID=A0A0T6LRM4_WENVI|nr:hypothetical protein [Wenjunlia vitaminophila]KRV48778.1 hypothetical protein AQ490_23185 [Wenjunlia vitaminophila]